MTKFLLTSNNKWSDEHFPCLSDAKWANMFAAAKALGSELPAHVNNCKIYLLRRPHSTLEFCSF